MISAFDLDEREENVQISPESQKAAPVALFPKQALQLPGDVQSHDRFGYSACTGS